MEGPEVGVEKSWVLTGNGLAVVSAAGSGRGASANSSFNVALSLSGFLYPIVPALP